MRFARGAALILVVAAGAAQAAPARYCGELGGANVAPVYDYRKGQGEYAAQLAQVERTSFTKEVAGGVRGPAAARDLDRTLLAFPNHTPALAALTRLALKEKQLHLPGTTYPVECYFDRAQRLAPDDGAVYASYANYLAALGQDGKAREMYQRAAALEPDNAVINYNLGLAYAKAGEYGKANEHAQRAYAAGFPLPGLRNLLKAAGKWQPPAPAQAAASESAAAPQQPAGSAQPAAGAAAGQE